jgi:hypothetical protein
MRTVLYVPISYSRAAALMFVMPQLGVRGLEESGRRVVYQEAFWADQSGVDFQPQWQGASLHPSKRKNNRWTTA